MSERQNTSSPTMAAKLTSPFSMRATLIEPPARARCFALECRPNVERLAPLRVATLRGGCYKPRGLP